LLYSRAASELVYRVVFARCLQGGVDRDDVRGDERRGIFRRHACYPWPRSKQRPRRTRRARVAVSSEDAGRKKTPLGSGVFHIRVCLSSLDVGSLLAFRALRDFELNFLTFFEGLETVHIDCGEVREQVLAAVIWSDEAKAFGIIEPLNCTCCHKELSK